MPGERNSSILLIHDDPDLLHSLTEVLEGAGFDVAIAATAFAATNQLEERSAEDEFQAVVAGWGAGGRSGLRVYCWVLEHRHHMRARFVFLAEEEPLGFKTLVKERCPLLKPSDTRAILASVRQIIGLPAAHIDTYDAEIDEVNDFDEFHEPSRRASSSAPSAGRSTPPKVPMPDQTQTSPPPVATIAPPSPSIASTAAAAAAAAARPSRQNDAVTTPPPSISTSTRPPVDKISLLLVEDEVLLLNFMRKRFANAGFAVTSADSGSEAIELLGGGDYDVVLADWYMPNGSGEELYNWIQLRRPELIERCFFMSGAVGAEVHSDIAPTGCKVFPKGQDPERMIQELLEVGRDAKR